MWETQQADQPMWTEQNAEKKKLIPKVFLIFTETLTNLLPLFYVVQITQIDL